MYGLTPEQIDALEDIIARRMANTGESRAEACQHLRRFFLERLGQTQVRVIDLDGRPDSE